MKASKFLKLKARLQQASEVVVEAAKEVSTILEEAAKEVTEEVTPIVESVEPQVNTTKKKTLKDAKQSA